MKYPGKAFWIVILLPACLISCYTPKAVYQSTGAILVLDSVSAPYIDSAMYYQVESYKKALDAEMNEVIGYTETQMFRDIPQGLLNNFVADIVLNKGNEAYRPSDGQAIDFCLLNYGGLRSSLPKGNITRGNVFELMPFENEMIVVTISGEKTKNLFEYLSRKNNWGMPVSGIKLTVKENEVVDVKIQGKSLDLSRNYKVLTSDYLATGGDKMDFFLQAIAYEPLNLRIREVIIEYIVKQSAQGKTAKSQIDDRFIVIE